MIQAQTIFNLAMSFMDKRNVNGVIDPTKTVRYAARTPDILTVWQNEIANDLVPVEITSLTDYLQINDNTAVTTGAFYLATHLLLVEDPESASYFNGKYNELKYKKRLPVSIEPITDVYGGGFYG